MSGGREERRPDRGARRPEPDDPDAPEFFLAVFQGGFSEARIFRAYPDANGVSFVYAGPAVLFLDLEVARGGSGGRKISPADSLKRGLLGAGAGILTAGAFVIAIAGRLALKDGANVTDLIAMLLTFGAVVAVAAVVVLTTSLRRITRRAEELDALSPEQVRAEAKTDKKSFRATAANMQDVRIDPHDRAGGGRAGSAARLSFRHEPTGKWKLSLLTRKDARVAARAFRQLLGKDGVEVNVSLKGE